MLVRSLPARVLTNARYAQPLASVRHLSMASRPSAAALGKRPAVPIHPRAMLAVSLGATRNISWNPLSKSTSPGPVPAELESAPKVPEWAADATATSSTPEATTASFSTPIPSSDLAAPSESAFAPAHLTSTAPDHQFHSDPSSLLPQSPANAATPTLEDLITNSGLPLEEVLASPEAVHAAMKLSDLKLMGLEHGMFSLPGWLRDALVGMHSVTGLPWWASIMALTLTLRMCLFPLLVRTTKHNVRMQAVNPQFTGIMKRMSESQKSGDQVGTQLAQQQLKTLMKEHDVSPFRGLILPLVSMPLFLSLFFGIRKLAELPLPQLHAGGFGWVTDLTLADPYFILPVTSLAFQVLVFAMGADTPAASSQRMMAHFRNGFIVASPLMLYVISGFPAAVLFYWTTTNAISALLAWTMRQTPVKRLLNIPTPKALPPPPNDAFIDPNPGFRDTWQAIKDKHKELLNKAETQHAENQRTRQMRERIRGPDYIKPGAEHTTKVQEVKRTTRTTDFLEVAKREAEKMDNKPLSPEEVKRRRIEEARRKRMQQ